MWTKRLLSVVGILAVGGVALAQNPFFSEIGANPPGEDNGYEYIEIEGVPDANSSALRVIVIDGKNGNEGTVLKVIPLTSAGTIGTNGVLLIRPTLDTPLGIFQFSPAPTAWTRIFQTSMVSQLANGSQTYVLGVGTTPALGNIVTGPISGFTVYDSVAYKHSAADHEYAVAIGGSNGTNLGTKPALMGALYRQIIGNNSKGAWAGGLLDLSKANPGPYAWRSGSFFGPSGWTSTSPVTGPNPGRINYRNRTIAGTLAVSPNDYAGTVGGSQSFTMQVYSITGTLLQTATLSILPSGNQAVAWSFTLNPSIDADRVQFRLKGSTFLAKRTGNLTVATSTGNIAFTLMNGDVDGSNAINTDDYLLVSNTFDTAFGDPGYTLAADLNKDGSVSTDDYIVLNANFDTEGDN